MKKNPSVEIIVLNYNTKDVTASCIDSLKKTNYDNYFITIVDNASTDGSFEFLRNKYSKIKLIRNKKNLGFTGGNNVAMKRSTKDYVVLLNSDTTVDKNWLKEMVNVAEKDKRIATCQSKILSMKDNKMFDFAGAAGCYIDLYGYPICRGRVFDEIEKDMGQYDDLVETFFSCGVSMLIRREALNKVGYLDEDFFLYAEEIDLSWRMLLVGYKHIYVPKSRVYHIGGYSTKRFSNDTKMLYYLHRNHLIILLKNYSFMSLLKYFPIKIFLDCAAFGAFLFTQPQRVIAILRSFIWLLFNPISILRKRRIVQKLRKISDNKIMNFMIATSVALGYHLKKKKTFNDYKSFIKYFN